MSAVVNVCLIRIDKSRLGANHICRCDTFRGFPDVGHPRSNVLNHMVGEAEMTSTPSTTHHLAERVLPPALVALLTPREAARILNVSESWLAKARMRGDGPAYIKVGRAVRYTQAALLQWLKSRQHLSTSEQ